MKKSLFSMGLMCLALTLTNCQKAQIEEVNPSPEANFELFASPAVATDAAITRTTNDGLATKWATGDQINIFHAPAGSTTYTNDKAFTLKDAATGSFGGTVGALDGGSYDWYAFYPYTSQITTPANTSAGWVVVGGKTPQTQIQNGNNSRTHLSRGACPLFGIAKAVESSAVPSIEMNHLTSIIKVQVTNNSSEDLKVENVSFTGTEDIVGTYYINFAASPVGYKPSGNQYVSNTASLEVKNGEVISSGASADFYIAVKPFTAKTGTTLKLAVNGYEKTLTLKNDITFTAGHIKPLNINYDKKVLDCVTLPWSIDGTDGSTVWKNTVGLSQNGLGSDYADGHKPYLTKLDTNNDYVQVKYDSPASFVKFAVKMIGGNNTSYMTVQGSAAGQSFTDIEKFTISGKNNDILSFTTSQPIDTEYRYIRLLFKKGSNVGLGAVEISKHSTDPVINADNVLGVPARGVVNQELAYTITNTVEGAVLSVAGDNTVVEAIEMDGTITYDVKKNTSKESREGSITLTYSKGGETLAEKTVKVQQLAPVFKVSRASVEIDATKGAQTTITVTSDFDWMADASASAGFSFSPNTYTWQEGGKETVTITASADNSSESGTATLGTITFSNIETKEEIIVTVAQKSSYVAPTTDTEVTYGIDAFSDGTSGSGSALTIANSDSNISLSGVGYKSGDHVKIYANNTLTVTPQKGKTITKIVITAKSNNYIKTWKASTGDVSVSGSTATWTGTSTTSITLTNSAAAQARITKVVVTYK